MVTLKKRLPLSEMLMQPDVADQLRQRFRIIQDSLTTTIHEASDLTGLSEAQLRYAESRQLLAPNRVIAGADPGGVTTTRGQRRYTVDDLLRAHLIAYLLDSNYSLSEIATFMEDNVSIIQDLLETTTLRLKPVLDAADDVMFKRFFIPRALHYALSLIFERDGVENAGLVFPVRAIPGALNAISPGEIETADDLIHLGHIMVAWRARGRPFSTFITAGNPFEREQQVCLMPFTRLKAVSDEAPSTSSAMPIHAYVAYSPDAERELLQADHLLSARQERYRERATGEHLANPRSVAGRLIRYVQTLRSSDFAAIGRTETSLNDALFFNTPQMMNTSLGDTLLNRLADAMVELGGEETPSAPSQASADGAQSPAEAKTRWRFSCVLMPREPDAPLKGQELVVRAQSKSGPHRIGVTTTSMQQNGGLTIRAYSSGHIAYRPEVIELDPAVSYVDVEYPIGSAIAAPAMDARGLEHSQPPAVIYIASRFPDNFDDDDFLMIRVMGHLVGEIVQTYNSRSHLPSALTDTLADPEMIDGLFADFRSELSFLKDLQRILQTLDCAGGGAQQPDQREQQPVRDEHAQELLALTLIGFDVNDLSLIQRRQGGRIARLITREIGNRLKLRIKPGLTQGVPMLQLYRIWGDRFYLLARDEDTLRSQQRGERIRKELSGVYQLDGDSLKFIRIEGDVDATSGVSGIPIGVRMAGISLTQRELGAQLQDANGNVTTCAASLSRLLEEGLKQAYDIPNKHDRAVWWSVTHDAFEPLIP